MSNTVYIKKYQEYSSAALNIQEEVCNVLNIPTLFEIEIIQCYDIDIAEEDYLELIIKNLLLQPQFEELITPQQALNDSRCKDLFMIRSISEPSQRETFASLCISILTGLPKPNVKYYEIYKLYGDLTKEQITIIRSHITHLNQSKIISLNKESITKKNPIDEEIIPIENFFSMEETKLKQLSCNYKLSMSSENLRNLQEYLFTNKAELNSLELKSLDIFYEDYQIFNQISSPIPHIDFSNSQEDENSILNLIKRSYEQYECMQKLINPSAKEFTLKNIGQILLNKLLSQNQLPHLHANEDGSYAIKVNLGSNNENYPYLLLFKTHAYSYLTQTHPLDAAATSVSISMRSALSSNAYAYAGARFSATKAPSFHQNSLKQYQIITQSSNGHSSYANQIGLCIGMAEEIYHDSFEFNHLELSILLACKPEEPIKTQNLENPNAILLIGGRTTQEDHPILMTKSTPPEQRKIQRLMPKASFLIKASVGIQRGGIILAVKKLTELKNVKINGVQISLDPLSTTSTSIISTATTQSEERLLVVVKKEDVAKFQKLANLEDLKATVIGETSNHRKIIIEQKGKVILDFNLKDLDPRAFTNSSNPISSFISKPTNLPLTISSQYIRSHSSIYPSLTSSNLNPSFKNLHHCPSMKEGFTQIARNLNTSSKRGLIEKFDNNIGCNTLLLATGGIYQKTPLISMVHKIPPMHQYSEPSISQPHNNSHNPIENSNIHTCSLMAIGGNPDIFCQSPYVGGYLAVLESLCKIIASGGNSETIYLSLLLNPQQDQNSQSSVTAMLGAMQAQLDFQCLALEVKTPDDAYLGFAKSIKESPQICTLFSIAFTHSKSHSILSPEFKKPNTKILHISPKSKNHLLPEVESQNALFSLVCNLSLSKRVLSMNTPGYGGIGENIIKMCMGNRIGVRFHEDIDLSSLFCYTYGSFILEVDTKFEFTKEELSKINNFHIKVRELGVCLEKSIISFKEEILDLHSLDEEWENTLNPIYPTKQKSPLSNLINTDISSIPIHKSLIHKNSSSSNIQPTHTKNIQSPLSSSILKTSPKAIITVFFGTNCEQDIRKAFEEAGAETEIFVFGIKDEYSYQKSIEDFSKKLSQAQILLIPGGFSGMDEPDGSGKMINAFFRNPQIIEAIEDFNDSKKLIGGICNGFQALIKSGLLPFGKITPPTQSSPTLASNKLGRYTCRMTHIKVLNNHSPWLSHARIGEIYTTPISHGEGRLIAKEEVLKALQENHQIATQYVNLEGESSMDLDFNPNGSLLSIEGITSPDGRIFGKMGHSERSGKNLYKNFPVRNDFEIFSSAVKYFL